MRYADENFMNFCRYYSHADYDKAADVLYKAIAATLQNEMQVNPLVKPDLKTMLQRFAQQHVAIPSREAFARAINAAVRVLKKTGDLDMRQSLN